MNSVLARLLIAVVCLAGVLGSLAVFELRATERAPVRGADPRASGLVEVKLRNPFDYAPQRLSPASIASDRELLARFADAVSQPDSGDAGADELRILLSWADFGETPTGVSMTGYIVRDGQIATCPVAFGRSLQDPLHGHCQKPTVLRSDSPLKDWSAFAGLGGFEYSCGTFDGYWVTIAGRRQGKAFLLEASNPSQCEDFGSKVIAALLGGL